MVLRAQRGLVHRLDRLNHARTARKAVAHIDRGQKLFALAHLPGRELVTLPSRVLLSDGWDGIAHPKPQATGRHARHPTDACERPSMQSTNATNRMPLLTGDPDSGLPAVNCSSDSVQDALHARVRKGPVPASAHPVRNGPRTPRFGPKYSSCPDRIFSLVGA